jgi:IS5 family transposase
VLQALHSLSGEATELQIKDRLSFQRFLGLGLDGMVPDTTTVWLLREPLVTAKATNKLHGPQGSQLSRHRWPMLLASATTSSSNYLGGILGCSSIIEPRAPAVRRAGR